MAPAPHETPPDGELAARRRRAALNFRAGALVILAATGISVLGPGPVGALVGLHVGWALWVAGVGELLVRGLVGERHAGVISTVGGLVFLPALLLVSGQTMQAPLALALLVLPLFIAAIAPADRLALWAASVGCIAWAALGGVWRGEPWTQVVAAVATTVCSSAVAAWGSVVYQRTEAARARAVEAHLEAARKLAETEQRTARAEHFALIGQMAANIAHHVNSPLAFVGANVRFVAEQLGQQPATDPDVLAALAESNDGLARIGSLVRELQSFARDERPHAVAADVGEAVKRVTHRLRSTLKPEAQVVVKVAVEPGLPRVAMAPHHLDEVLEILLVHAVESLALAPPGAPRVVELSTAHGPDGQVRLVVEDSGPGIAEADLERIFVPFFVARDEQNTARPRVALGRALVERSGGRLWVANRPEGGARFECLVPAGEAE